MNQDYSTGNRIVDEVGRINISGNIIPMVWFQAIRYPNGKPNVNAIIILADIVYWYRPTEIRDEITGQVVGRRKKFRDDLLQRSYGQISELFGLTKKQVVTAVNALEQMGVIKRNFRNMRINGQFVSNVLYLELIPQRLHEITYPGDMLLVDEVVNALISGLILEAQREEVQINEFAKTYLLIKFRPNNIEYMEKQDEISNYKRELTIKKNKLLDCRERNPQIDNILKEWQPNNLIDELAIVDAFEAYTHFNVWRVVNKKGYKNKNYTLDSVNQYFKKIEETSTHPYIYAQKARILLPLLRFKKENREKIKECLKDSFEKTIISVETQYINIKGTISYASILRELGKFYLEDSGNVDYNKAANYSEKAKVIYEKIDKGNRYYYFTIRNLAKAYIGLYGKTQEKAYVSEALKLWNQIQKYEGNDLEALKKEAQESMDYCIDLL